MEGVAEGELFPFDYQSGCGPPEIFGGSFDSMRLCGKDPYLVGFADAVGFCFRFGGPETPDRRTFHQRHFQVGLNQFPPIL